MLLELLRPLALSAQIKDELYPILLFFGMFIVIFGLGGVVIRHIPRKPGSMLDEVLREEWESDEDAQKLPENPEGAVEETERSTMESVEEDTASATEKQE